MPAVSSAKEGKSLRHEIGVVLEDPTMPGVFVDHEFCLGDTSGHVRAVDGRDHDVVVSVRDQDRTLDAAEILRRLATQALIALSWRRKALGLGPLSRCALRSFNRLKKACADRRPLGVDVKNR